MGTTNFNITRVMDKLNFPLIVMSDEMLYKYMMEEEPTEDIDTDDFAWEVHNGFECVMSDIQSEYDELRVNLHTLSVDIVDGYYTGVQFIVDTNNLDCDYLSIDAYDNWDEWELWNYFHADTIEEAKENLANEIRLINKFFDFVKQFGFRELNLVGVFSNGEGVYEWAE